MKTNAKPTAPAAPPAGTNTKGSETTRFLVHAYSRGRIDLFLPGGRLLAAVIPPGPHRLADEWTALDCEGRAVEKNTREDAYDQAEAWANAWISRNGGIPS